MSFNDQLAINISFSKTNMPKVTKGIRDIYNEYMDYLYDVSLALYDKIKKEKLKTKSDVINHFNFDCGSSWSFPSMPRSNKFHVPVYTKDSDTILDELFRGKSVTKPRKSAFKKLTSKDKSFNIESSSLSGWSINSEESEVLFSTDYNNHSADDIDLPLSKTILNYLVANRKWGRSEGGFSMYQSENQKKDEFSARHFDSEFANDFYGPLGEKYKKRVAQYHKRMSQIYSY